jgi:two-component system sensor histidine kinase KdpD
VQAALVEQALVNVLENAASFAPPGTVVSVRAGLAGAGLRIEVGDAGPGIPEAERDRVFDMFYRSERGDQGRRGAGLGLAICRGMIAAHGGSVEALEGSAGRGTTLRITLPLAAMQAAAP